MKKLIFVCVTFTFFCSCKKEVITKSHFIGEIYGGGIIIEVNNDLKKFDFGYEKLDKYRHLSPKSINIFSFYDDEIDFLEKILDLYDP